MNFPLHLVKEGLSALKMAPFLMSQMFQWASIATSMKKGLWKFPLAVATIVCRLGVESIPPGDNSKPVH
jgi:hypothetical protein